MKIIFQPIKGESGLDVSAHRNVPIILCRIELSIDRQKYTASTSPGWPARPTTRWLLVISQLDHLHNISSISSFHDEDQNRRDNQCRPFRLDSSSIKWLPIAKEITFLSRFVLTSQSLKWKSLIAPSGDNERTEDRSVTDLITVMAGLGSKCWSV